MTEQQIMEAVGLKTWDEFLEEVFETKRHQAHGLGAVRTLTSDWDRRTGRTTRMLLAAAEKCMRGERVYVSGHDHKSSCQLQKQLREWLVVCKVPRSVTMGLVIETQQSRADAVFSDHYRG
jgi:hypothetical protein